MTAALTELFSTPGKTNRVTVTCDLTEINGYEITYKEPFEVILHHERNRVFTLQGSSEVKLMMSCDRCMKPVEVTVPVELERKFNGLDHTDEDGERAEAFLEEGIDMDLLILEAVSEAMPMKVLCQEDCKGICPTCGADLNLGPCPCGQEEKPTRMGDAIARAFLEAQNKKKK